MNGRATLHDDDALRERCRHGDHLPLLVIKVHVDAAYLHCAKALMRSRLWDPSSRIPRETLPTLGEMLRDQLHSSEPAESQAAMLERYRKILY